MIVTYLIVKIAMYKEKRLLAILSHSAYRNRSCFVLYVSKVRMSDEEWGAVNVLEGN